MLEMDKGFYEKLIEMALEEDVKNGDLTSISTIPSGSNSNAVIKAKEAGVICGLNVAEAVFKKVDSSLSFQALKSDGDQVFAGDIICEISGNTVSLLSAERTALNFLSRMSGIATQSNFYAEKVKGTSADVYDTRKTLPGWRMLEKYSVSCGGGCNHRVGLWDAILIKENHIKAAGSVRSALEKAKKYKDQVSFIEVEVETLEEMKEAMACAPDIVLLDNMSISQLKNAVEIRTKYNYNDILLDASGNITMENLADVAATGVDRISIGALTHSAKNFDLSLLIQ